MKKATTSERQMGEALRGLNAAVSLWYTRGTHSFDAALRQAPEHATARLCRAHALKTLGRPAEAARDLSTALALDSLPECLRSSTTQELDVLHRSRLETFDITCKKTLGVSVAGTVITVLDLT